MEITATNVEEFCKKRDTAIVKQWETALPDIEAGRVKKGVIEAAIAAEHKLTTVTVRSIINQKSTENERTTNHPDEAEGAQG